MKRASAFVFILSFLVCLCAASCNNSVDDMLGDYNGGFEKGYTVIQTTPENEEPILSPGDEGFHQEDMLRDEYFLGWDATLNLYAPPNSYNPVWYMTDPEALGEQAQKEYIPICVFDDTENSYTTVTSAIFSIFAPTSLLEEGHTYKLTLTVEDKEGYKYTDTCCVVVYLHIDSTNL